MNFAINTRGVASDGRRVSLWIKVPYSVFVCLLVPVYWVEYGPANFLWFSDIALLVTVIAPWLENRLLVSMMAVVVVLLELAWNLDFLLRLVAGIDLIGLASYMFDPRINLFVRLLSLFRIALPVLLLWALYRLGYDRRAPVAQALLAWIVPPISYLVSNTSDNKNWVFGFGNQPQTLMPGPLYVALLMILFPIFIYLPSHLVLKKVSEP